MLQAISAILPNKRNPFPVIVGTSVGAINAMALASHARSFRHGVAHIAKLWETITTDQVYRTDFTSITLSGAHWLLSLTPLARLGLEPPRSIFDNAPLHRFISNQIDFTRIDKAIRVGALRAVGVTAASYERERAITFFQGRDELQGWTRARRSGVPVRIRLDHVLASVALPFIFPAQQVGSEYFGDGSLRLTAPLSPAIHCGAEKILVIGLRNAAPAARPLAGYPSLGRLIGYLLDTIFMDNIDADVELSRRFDDMVAILPRDAAAAHSMRNVEVLMVQPSRDLGEIASDHVHEMPWTVRMLLRRLGLWTHDWRLVSYLLFSGGYCSALVDLGYRDAMARRQEIERFLAR